MILCRSKTTKNVSTGDPRALFTPNLLCRGVNRFVLVSFDGRIGVERRIFVIILTLADFDLLYDFGSLTPLLAPEILVSCGIIVD